MPARGGRAGEGGVLPFQPDKRNGAAAQGGKSDQGLGCQDGEMPKFQNFIQLYKIFV
jgi:hypothetical protein